MLPLCRPPEKSTRIVCIMQCLKEEKYIFNDFKNPLHYVSSQSLKTFFKSSHQVSFFFNSFLGLEWKNKVFKQQYTCLAVSWCLESLQAMCWPSQQKARTIFSPLLTTFNQSSIKIAACRLVTWPWLKYVRRRESCLCPLTDDQREASVCPYLHLSLLSDQPAHERGTRNNPPPQT